MSFFIVSFAHRGKTDSEGGHYDHDSGEYHYHHGYPAHQHINGVCEYDFNNNEDSTELHGYAYIEKDKPTHTTEYVENTKVANAYNYTFESDTTTKQSFPQKVKAVKSNFYDVFQKIVFIGTFIFIAFLCILEVIRKKRK